MKLSDEDLDLAWSNLHPGVRVRWITPTFVRRGTIARVKGRSMAIRLDGLSKETIVPDARWYYAQGKSGNLNEHLVAISTPPPKPLSKKTRKGMDPALKAAVESMSDNDLIGPAEAANILGVDQKTLRRKLRGGKLPGTQNESGRWILKRSEIEKAR